MREQAGRGPRARLRLVALLLGAALVGGCAGCGSVESRPDVRPGTAVSGEPDDPVVLDIPAIDVHSPLLRLGLDARGAVEVPPLESDEAGWYEHSPAPGERGPAVLLGHVDSARSGPSVFFRLRDLRAADVITVGRADGSTVAFRVDRVAEYHKSAFPTAEVYGDIDHPGLRLITCGGPFDRAAHSYVDDVVVFASSAFR